MSAEPHIHLWTRSEYYKMAEIGLFHQKRVELIEGQVIEMGPMGSLHATGVTLAGRTLERVFGQNYFVRWQMPFDAGEISEPEPDIAIIFGDIRDYKEEHPTKAVLLVEIADTSLEYDRKTKGSLYAKAGILDYWIINLENHQLEVYRKPVIDLKQAYGYAYSEKAIFKVSDFITPLAMQQTVIAVAELLP